MRAAADGLRRAERRGLGVSHRDLGLDVGERRLLVVDDRALVDVAETEPEHRDTRDDGAGLENAGRGEVLADCGPGMTGACVGRKKIDGFHQFSTPSPIATASDARSSRSAVPFET